MARTGIHERRTNRGAFFFSLLATRSRPGGSSASIVYDKPPRAILPEVCGSVPDFGLVLSPELRPVGSGRTTPDLTPIPPCRTRKSGFLENLGQTSSRLYRLPKWVRRKPAQQRRNLVGTRRHEPLFPPRPFKRSSQISKVLDHSGVVLALNTPCTRPHTQRKKTYATGQSFVGSFSFAFDTNPSTSQLTQPSIVVTAP